MLPEVNRTAREECSVSEIGLGVKCGGSDGAVLITEVPEFCGAEHLLACRAKDVETGREVYSLMERRRSTRLVGACSFERMKNDLDLSAGGVRSRD
jgi:altronate dehydratase